jgi:hypothetical protein
MHHFNASFIRRSHVLNCICQYWEISDNFTLSVQYRNLSTKTRNSTLRAPHIWIYLTSVCIFDQERRIVRVQLATAVSMKMAVFWVVAPCTLVQIYQRLRRPYCLHHQCDRPETPVNSYQSTRRYNPEDSHLQDVVSQDVAPCSLVEIDRHFRGSPLMTEAVSISEMSTILTKLDSAISQKTAIFKKRINFRSGYRRNILQQNTLCFHDDVLGFDVVYNRRQISMFRKNIVFPSSGLNSLPWLTVC